MREGRRAAPLRAERSRSRSRTCREPKTSQGYLTRFVIPPLCFQTNVSFKLRPFKHYKLFATNNKCAGVQGLPATDASGPAPDS